MKPIITWLQLMRFHKPVGLFLLFFPTLWALWLANHGRPPLSLLTYFLAGSILMRAAGCIMNDIADRLVDKHVKRTQTRPLTTGEVHLFTAWALLIALCLGAFVILVQLPTACFYYAVAALLIVLIYPFGKRFFHGPQCVLGIAFSMGIPMAYVASEVPFDSTMGCLLVINMLWIITYDTMYAMVDRLDDLRIGVKSTAVLFAHHDRAILFSMQMIFHGLWLFIASQTLKPMYFYLIWFLAALLLLLQQHWLGLRNPTYYFKAFTSNVWYGALLSLAIISAS